MHWFPSGYQNNPRNDEDNDGIADKPREMEKPNVTVMAKKAPNGKLPPGRSIEDPTLRYAADGTPARWVEFRLKRNKTYGAGRRLRYIPFEGIFGDGSNPDQPASWHNVDGLQLDLSSLDDTKYYYLEADVYIEKHTLEDSGSFAGSEWPMNIEISYADAGNNSRQHYWGFLDGVDMQMQRPYTEVVKGTWYHHRSVELLTELFDIKGKTTTHPVSRITNLRVSSYGWDADVRIANIDIHVYDSQQTSSPDDQP